MSEIRGQLDIFGGEKTGNEAYEAFTDKFVPKKTTDDCYTPELVYDAVADWVAGEYGADRSTFVRPFWPGGEYERFEYPDGCVVVDNPPFSLMAKIVEFYSRNLIRYFLFAPTLTLLQRKRSDVCHIMCGVQITYANGAEVNTSFLTNLEPDPNLILRSVPTLYAAIKTANDKNLASAKVQLPKYVYPNHVLTIANTYKFSRLGIDYRLDRRDCTPISALDAQRHTGKECFGGALLLGNRAAAERAAAERAAVQKWQLSDREKSIAEYLDQWRGAT